MVVVRDFTRPEVGELYQLFTKQTFFLFLCLVLVLRDKACLYYVNPIHIVNVKVCMIKESELVQ